MATLGKSSSVKKNKTSDGRGTGIIRHSLPSRTCQKHLSNWTHSHLKEGSCLLSRIPKNLILPISELNSPYLFTPLNHESRKYSNLRHHDSPEFLQIFCWVSPVWSVRMPEQQYAHSPLFIYIKKKLFGTCRQIYNVMLDLCNMRTLTPRTSPCFLTALRCICIRVISHQVIFLINLLTTVVYHVLVHAMVHYWGTWTHSIQTKPGQKKHSRSTQLQSPGDLDS